MGKAAMELRSTRRAGARLQGVAAFMMVALLTCAAHAEADGPDFLRVTGVRDGGTLNIRSGPSTNNQAIGSLSFDADGIRNLGCEGGPTFAEWQQASPAEREAARKRRWCRIEHGGTVGWAAGWHLAEGSAPAAASSIAQSDLVGVRWRLVASPSGPAVGEAWLELATDGAVHGKLGCNSFRGTAQIDDEEIHLSPLATTKMFCTAPGGDAQEQAMLAVLSSGPVRWQVADGLVLTSTDGLRELRFAAE
jgi:heat shock protein HslJ